MLSLMTSLSTCSWSMLGTARSKSRCSYRRPDRRADVKAKNDPDGTMSAGPVGFLLSRMAMRSPPLPRSWRHLRCLELRGHPSAAAATAYLSVPEAPLVLRYLPQAI